MKHIARRTRIYKACIVSFIDEEGEGIAHESPRYEDEPREKGKERKRGTFPKIATNILKSWLFQHLSVSEINHFLQINISAECS